MPSIMLTSISCRAILLWCVSFCVFSSFFTPTINANETDRLALLAIKSQLQDQRGVTSSWNNSVKLCQWRGITCGRRHQRVTELHLSYQSIRGSLSPYIGNLSFLRSIYLDGNSLYGEIPQEIGRLSRLQILVLTNNSFSFNIPTNLSRCSKLTDFVADHNNLVGIIPPEFGYLLKLERLYIASNHLTGQLPASIGNLSTLHEIDLQENNLKGWIPDTLGKLRKLYYLNVRRNNYSGMVPRSIYNISSLEALSLSENTFTGNLPLNIGFTLPNLKVFLNYDNNFTGPLPDSFSNSSKLVDFDLSENSFFGKLSIDFSAFKNLRRLNLATNLLGTGKDNDLEFLSSLTNCSKLEAVGFDKNQFGGVLPRSIANLSTTLTEFVFTDNQISGSIPPGMANLFRLGKIAMEQNQLSGTIPHGVGQLKKLQILYLNDNNLQGSIPTFLGNLTLLYHLDLSSNYFQGNIPSSLGNCQNLNMLGVSSNKLTGSVPQEILGITTLSTYLSLDDNLLSGPFPSEVGNLKNLVSLDVSKNKFSGQIPDSIGGCTSLESLYMQDNSFNGNIPFSMISLRSIKELDLSSNNLSGQIPKVLENLSFLEYLNLSTNQFEGEVPTKGVFSNTTKFSLTGNEKLCGGLEELHLPSCQSKGSREQKITLLKVLIPVIGSCLIVSACFILVLTRKRKPGNLSQMEEQYPTVSYAELSKATNEFSSSNMIGRGSYGTVYKGILSEMGMLVAVKVLNLMQKGASKSFMVECRALRSIRHRNLIKIVTICSSIDFKGSDFKALVYEYMQNGSLEEWLHQRDDEIDVRKLSLIQRLNIAIDVASAIEYLHHNCQPPIVHGDLKPSNILLNHDMVAHVGDFGLARFLSDHSVSTTSKTQSSSVWIKGTVGYVAPEYGMSSDVSMSGDVYSFGIMLLEMFTSKRPTEDMFNDGLTLHGYAKRALPEKVLEIIEPSLLCEVRTRDVECLVSVVSIGVLCSMESPTDRMEMTDVAAKLCAIRKKFLGNRIEIVRC